MTRLKYLFFTLATISLSYAVKINMQGSVSLGKEVLQTISHYLINNGALGILTRRSGGSHMTVVDTSGSERIKWTIHAANIGKGVKIYSGPLGDFLREYVVILATAIESILDGIITLNDKDTKGAIFVEQLKPVLSDIHDILKESDKKMADDKELFEWITIIKKISAKYQKAAIKFVEDRLDGDPQDILNVKKKLTQKLVIAMVLVENKYENKLCDEHHICEKDYTVTTALNTLLSEFENVDKEKAMEFLKFFYENIPENLFYFLNMDTTHELQVILSDLSYAKNSPAKDVLLSVHKTVDARAKRLKNETEMSKAYDQQLVNAILSDMDYFYHKSSKSYPFDVFLGQFQVFLKSGGKFGAQMRTVIKEIKEQLHDQTPALLEKLQYEARVFLELTVDPEK